MPWPLQVAIEHALIVINWYENLPKHEVPPEYLWADAEGLELWWANVEARREDGQPTSTGGADDWADGKTPEMAENDLAKFLKG